VSGRKGRRTIVTTKEFLHQLVEELPDDELREAHAFLEYLRLRKADPVLRAALLAPLDDEPDDPAEDAEAAEGWQEYLRGEYATDAELGDKLDRSAG
jgi:hypothetical protein